MSTVTTLQVNDYELRSFSSSQHGSNQRIPSPTSREGNEIQRASSRRSATSMGDVYQVPDASPLADEFNAVRLTRANLITLQVSVINFLTSVSSGLIVVGLPRMAADLALPEQVYLWPTSVYGLTTGSALLLAGAIADVVGARSVDLVGCTLLAIFTVACGVSQTGIQLVMFRAFQGVATAMHLPCSVALVTQYVPSGKARNIGFACLGLSQPLGFSIGLVVGGILVDTIGWRVGFYMTGGFMFVQVLTGFKIMPPDTRPQNVMIRLKSEIDWVGAFIACAGLAMFSYVLAVLSADSNSIQKPTSVAMLVVSVVLMIAFPFWMRFQEKRGLPALVPNYLWRNLSFTSICILTVFTWGVQNSMELFCSLYFQEVQEFSAIQASLRMLPAVIAGVFLNFTTGYMIDKVPAFWLLLVTTVLTSGSPLIMALIPPQLSFWEGAFFAQVLSPLGGDVLFTVGLIVVSEVFAEKDQALAGAVFNTVAYFGLSLGLNAMQVVSLLVTKSTQYRDKTSPAALLRGYQASFWAMFGLTLVCAVVCIAGMRKMGKVGLKRE